jgi:hypothetical protein
METLFVKAPPGKICPKELSRERISDAEFIEVPNTSFYRRMIAEGGLLVREAAETPAEAPAPAGKQTKKTKGGNS